MRDGAKRARRPSGGPYGSRASTCLASTTIRTLMAIGLGLVVLVPSAATAISAKSIGSKLLPGSLLTSGSWLESPNGMYRLVMQRDGNLVLYGKGVVVWASDTAYHPGAAAVMQRDGNLVVYQGHNSIWSSGTDRPGDSGSALVLENDGNVVIYSAAHKLKGTNTSIRPLSWRSSVSSDIIGRCLYPLTLCCIGLLRALGLLQSCQRSEHDKDVELTVLREVRVLERQLHAGLRYRCSLGFGSCRCQGITSPR